MAIQRFGQPKLGTFDATVSLGTVAAAESAKEGGDTTPADCSVVETKLKKANADLKSTKNELKMANANLSMANDTIAVLNDDIAKLQSALDATTAK